MKVIFASGTFFPETSGQSNFVYNFIKHADLDGETVVIAYGRENENKIIDVGDNKVKAIIIKRDFWRYWNYFRELKKHLKKADIIYAQDLVSSGLPAALAKNRKVKLAVRIGGDFLWEKMINEGRIEVPLSRYYDEPKSAIEKVFLSIYRFVMSRCDLLVFNTEWQKNIYQKYFKLIVNKIEVIPNPLMDTSEIGAQSEDGNEIIFAGRFIPLKNLARLIDAFLSAKSDRRLVLIGQGPLRGDLNKMAAENHRLTIIDSLPQRDLWQRIARCHLLILPSISEVNPSIALEALSLRKAVILTEENGLENKWKQYFKFVDPFSSADLKEAIEYFEDDVNCQNHVKMISRADLNYGWNDVIAKHQSARII